MGEKATDFVGDGVVPELMENAELFYRGETPVQKEVGEFKEIWEKGNKPTKPGIDREGLAILKKEKNNQDTGRKIGQQFLDKSGLVTFDFLG